MNHHIFRTTGGIWPVGVPTSLTWFDIGAILHILHVARIRACVEIGVEHGGLAGQLRAYGHYTGMAYRGYDITLGELHPVIAADNLDVIHQRDAHQQRTIAEVQAWIGQQAAPALIFCDGLGKPAELQMYAPLIRSGDVLLGHDYGNEYQDDALEGMPAHLERVRPDWLDVTLLCLFVPRGEADRWR